MWACGGLKVMKRRHGGFTVTELIVVIGVITILASLLWPSLSAIRGKAKRVQCANNLTVLHQALTMYSVDNSRLEECYPAYLTNLFSVNLTSAGANGAYVSDERAFVCPMDDTKATQNQKGITVLKPGNPQDNKADWAERIKNGLGQRNCSYLYEFSGRICETYGTDPFGGSWDGTPSNFGDSYLVTADDPYWNPSSPYPSEVARDPIPMDATGTSFGVTWQDMKFHQLAYGDIYITGALSSSINTFPDPPPDFNDPYDYYDMYDTYFDNDYQNVVTSYSRTWMPIIRCFWHINLQHIDSEAYEEVQNMSLDGNVFNSSPFWERTAFKYGPKEGWNWSSP